MKFTFVNTDSVGFMAEGVAVEQIVTNNLGGQTIILTTPDGGSGTITLSPEEVAQSAIQLPLTTEQSSPNKKRGSKH